MFHIHTHNPSQLFSFSDIMLHKRVEDERKNDGVIIERLKVASNKELVKVFKHKKPIIREKFIVPTKDTR